MHFHRRQLRRWAAGVLLAWVFGVLSGVVQACALSAESAPDQHAPRSGPAALVQAHQHAAEEHPDGSSEQAPCHDFCQKSSNAVPGTNPLDGKADLAASPPPGLAALPALDARVARMDADPLVQRGAPPIAIAFLRLTL